MNVINWLINNWFLVLVGICIAIYCIIRIYTFFKQSPNKQKADVKEWLLYAVMTAEKELGSGTGDLKLRYVYNMFLRTFPQLALIIPFDVFKGYVDEALKKLQLIITNNENAKKYIEE